MAMQDDLYEFEGSHVFLPGGNLRLVQALGQDVPIFYKAPARLVQYSETGVRMALCGVCAAQLGGGLHPLPAVFRPGVLVPALSGRGRCCLLLPLALSRAPQVRVHSDAGVFAADAVLVTVPLGVLKRPGALRFDPPLPPRKQAAIDRLGFGCLNKVSLLFPHCFWGEHVVRGGGGGGRACVACMLPDAPVKRRCCRATQRTLPARWLAHCWSHARARVCPPLRRTCLATSTRTCASAGASSCSTQRTASPAAPC
jgi:hypothetical protein